jgi:hypothetical protein
MPGKANAAEKSFLSFSESDLTTPPCDRVELVGRAVFCPPMTIEEIGAHGVTRPTE